MVVSAGHQNQAPLGVTRGSGHHPYAVQTSRRRCRVIGKFIGLLHGSVRGYQVFLGLSRTSGTMYPPPPSGSRAYTMRGYTGPSSDLASRRRTIFTTVARKRGIFLDKNTNAKGACILRHFVRCTRDGKGAMLHVTPANVTTRVVRNAAVRQTVRTPAAIVKPSGFRSSDCTRRVKGGICRMVTQASVVVISRVSVYHDSLFTCLSGVVLTRTRPRIPFHFSTGRSDPGGDRRLAPVQRQVRLVLYNSFTRLPPVVDGGDQRI